MSDNNTSNQEQATTLRRELEETKQSLETANKHRGNLKHLLHKRNLKVEELAAEVQQLREELEEVKEERDGNLNDVRLFRSLWIRKSAEVVALQRAVNQLQQVAGEDNAVISDEE